jgi:hypothetical protein
MKNKPNNYLEIIAKLVDNFYHPACENGTFSLKPSLRGNILALKFMTVVHFASEQPMPQQIKPFADHANQLFNDMIKELRTKLKKETGLSLEIKQLNRDDGFELIHATSHSPRKVAYYRAVQNYELL